MKLRNQLERAHEIFPDEVAGPEFRIAIAALRYVSRGIDVHMAQEEIGRRD